MPTNVTKPLPIQIEVEFLDRLSEPVRDGRVASVSELIRKALERFDFDNVVVVHPAQLQVSVRLPVELRRTLRKVSRAKHTSVGQLVRSAVEAYLPTIEPRPLKPKPAAPAKKKKSRSLTRKRK